MKLKKLLENKKVFYSVVFLLAISILLISLISFSLSHTYNSDEVHLQTMFNNDTIFSGQVKYFGISSFVFKLPFIYFARIFSNYSKFAIFLPTLLVNIISVVLYIWSAIYFIKKFNISKNKILFPLWTLSLGGGFIFYLYNLNSRNVEIGLVFATLALAHKYITEKIESRLFYMGSALISIIWGLILVSDNYYLYMVILPFLFISLFNYYSERNKKYLNLAIISAVTVGLYFLFDYIYVALNFIDYESVISFGSYNQIIEKVYNFPKTIFGFTGNSFFGQKVTKFSTIKSVFNSIIIIYGFALAFLSIKARQSKGSFIYFPGIMLIGLLIWVVSDRQFDYYLVLIPFFLGIIIMLHTFKNVLIERLSILFVSLALILNIIFLLNSLRINLLSGSVPNENNYQLIEVIKKEGFNYGYAPFWDSTINTFLSKDRIKFIQAKCLDGKIFIDRWYLTEADLNNRNQGNNFFVLDTNQPQGCTKEVILSSLGEPYKISSQGSYEIYFYNKNLSGLIK